MNEGTDIRAKGVRALRTMVAALGQHASPGHARIRTGPHRAFYEPVWDELQGYARPLWGMAALAQSGEGAALGDPVWQDWQQGLLAGTDPAHPEYWGATGDFSQAFCEMAPIALSLLWAGEYLWQPLTSAQRERVLAWLDQINHHQLHPNNWLWFRVLVNAVFFHLGAACHRANLERDIAVIESLAGEGGWYVDGRPPGSRTADLYIPSGFHVYGLIAPELLEPLYPGHCQKWRARAKQFAGNWKWFQAQDGAPLLWGRSLCYRSCSAAFWSACAWADFEALPWDEVAGLWRNQMAWWQTHETLREDGCLSLGFAYPMENLCESYMSHTSPYWQTKAWLALRQPASHPFWSTAPATISEQPPATIPLPTCGGLLVPDSNNPLLLLVGQHGADWLDPEGARYGRFAYDTHHGFQITPGTPSPDNALLVRPVGSEAWKARRSPESWSVSEKECSVTWSPMEGVHIATTLRPGTDSAQPGQPGHTRIHRISTTHPIEVLEGGFACPPGTTKIENHRASIHGGGLFSAIVAQDGRRACIVEPPTQTNTLHRQVVIPALSASLPAGEHFLAAHLLMENSGK